jgi:hypothetical protein
LHSRFAFFPGWYRRAELRDLALSYYYVLRSIVRGNSQLRRCLTRCRHCGIFFITDPRNAKRTDLGCPFGCRETHRKRSSTERSVAYYQTAEGRGKRRLQNEKRRAVQVEQAEEQGQQAEEQGSGVQEEMTRRPGCDGSAAALGLVLYLVMVTSLVEGRRVSRKEVEEMMKRVLRQRRMARRSRMEYVVWRLNQVPP